MCIRDRPNSACRIFPRTAQRAPMARPTANEPVKDMAAMSGWTTTACPVPASPSTTLTQSSGKPASARVSSTCAVTLRAGRAGFQRTVFPLAKAGAILPTGIASGLFQGVISPTTPLSLIHI